MKTENTLQAHAKRGSARLSSLLERLLSLRGIKGQEAIEDFLNPKYVTGDPFEMKDMKKAVWRIMDAIKKNEKVVIFSDYDADGIPGAVILHDFFKKAGFHNFDVYIPHRYEEGFGLNMEAIEQFGGNKVGLLITVDCGSSDVGPAKKAKELGIDVIITDHHIVGPEAPEVYALVNPNQSGDEYPFKDLCGAGVVFKLVEALLLEIRNSKFEIGAASPIPDGWEKWLLDMVGIATLSDMVPLVGENRVFAHFGLKVLRKSPRPGLKAMLKKLRMDQKNLAEDDVTFSITPRINAASRMGIPTDAFRLLATNDEGEAKELAEHLDFINNERKGLVASMIKEATKRIEARGVRDVLVVGDPKWKPGLVGLAAQRLSEAYEKPSFVWGREGSSVIRGSCRSSGGINVVELMERSKECFIEYGGHEFSGGFSVSHEHIHVLEETLLKQCSLADQPSLVDQEPSHDGILSLDEISASFWQDIKKLSPFGEGNPKPIFLLIGVRVEKLKWFGKGSEHLSISFRNSKGKFIEAISFFADKDVKLNKINEGERIDLLANLEESFFGRGGIRLRIVGLETTI